MPTWPCELHNSVLLPLSPLGGWFCFLVLFGCWRFGGSLLAVGLQPVQQLLLNSNQVTCAEPAHTAPRLVQGDVEVVLAVPLVGQPG